MIKLPEGELRDYLPATMKNDVDMICLSYAVRKETEQLVKYRKAAMIYRFIDSVPESILDLLAVELRSLYYSDALPVETKRNIVKNTLRWHMQAGTPGAVAEMVKIVFGDGEIVEWPDFKDPPYTPGTFDIVTDAQLTPVILDYSCKKCQVASKENQHYKKMPAAGACRCRKLDAAHACCSCRGIPGGICSSAGNACGHCMQRSVLYAGCCRGIPGGICSSAGNACGHCMQAAVQADCTCRTGGS